MQETPYRLLYLREEVNKVFNRDMTLPCAGIRDVYTTKHVLQTGKTLSFSNRVSFFPGYQKCRAKNKTCHFVANHLRSQIQFSPVEPNPSLPPSQFLYLFHFRTINLFTIKLCYKAHHEKRYTACQNDWRTTPSRLTR